MLEMQAFILPSKAKFCYFTSYGVKLFYSASSYEGKYSPYCTLQLKHSYDARNTRVLNEITLLHSLAVQPTFCDRL